MASEACDESEGNADDETQELEETAGNDGPEKAVVRPRTRPQGMPRSRQRGTLVPVGWTPVRYNGEAHYRCPSTCETLTGEVRRCAYHCRKYLIEKHTVHDYSIAHEDDELAVPQEAPRLRTTEAVNTTRSARDANIIKRKVMINVRMKIEGVKLLYILLNYHTENTESTEMFCPAKWVSHSFYKN